MEKTKIGEVIGLLAVVAGLVFVGLEIRQNNRLAEAEAYLDIGAMTADNWFRYAREPEYNLVYRQSFAGDDEWWAGLSAETTAQLASDMQGAVRHYETIYLLVDLGVLDEIALTRLGWDAFGDLPSVRRLWPCLYISSDDVRARLTRNWEDVPTLPSSLDETLRAFGDCSVQSMH
jgi:hypothetical protein